MTESSLADIYPVLKSAQRLWAQQRPQQLFEGIISV